MQRVSPERRLVEPERAPEGEGDDAQRRARERGQQPREDQGEPDERLLGRLSFGRDDQAEPPLHEEDESAGEHDEGAVDGNPRPLPLPGVGPGEHLEVGQSQNAPDEPRHVGSGRHIPGQDPGDEATGHLGDHEEPDIEADGEDRKHRRGGEGGDASGERRHEHQGVQEGEPGGQDLPQARVNGPAPPPQAQHDQDQVERGHRRHGDELAGDDRIAREERHAHAVGGEKRDGCSPQHRGRSLLRVVAPLEPGSRRGQSRGEDGEEAGEDRVSEEPVAVPREVRHKGGADEEHGHAGEEVRVLRDEAAPAIRARRLLLPLRDLGRSLRRGRDNGPGRRVRSPRRFRFVCRGQGRLDRRRHRGDGLRFGKPGDLSHLIGRQLLPPPLEEVVGENGLRLGPAPLAERLGEGRGPAPGPLGDQQQEKAGGDPETQEAIALARRHLREEPPPPTLPVRPELLAEAQAQHGHGALLRPPLFAGGQEGGDHRTAGRGEEPVEDAPALLGFARRGEPLGYRGQGEGAARSSVGGHRPLRHELDEGPLFLSRRLGPGVPDLDQAIAQGSRQAAVREQELDKSSRLRQRSRPAGAHPREHGVEGLADQGFGRGKPPFSFLEKEQVAEEDDRPADVTVGSWLFFPSRHRVEREMAESRRQPLGDRLPRRAQVVGTDRILALQPANLENRRTGLPLAPGQPADQLPTGRPGIPRSQDGGERPIPDGRRQPRHVGAEEEARDREALAIVRRTGGIVVAHALTSARRRPPRTTRVPAIRSCSPSR